MLAAENAVINLHDDVFIIYDPSTRPQTKELFEILWNYQGESLEAIWCCLQSANAIAGSISAVMMMMTKAMAKMIVLTLKPASSSRSCPDTVGVMSGLNWHQMDPCRTITNLYLEPSGTTWHHVGLFGSIRSHLRAIWDQLDAIAHYHATRLGHNCGIWGLGFRCKWCPGS